MPAAFVHYTFVKENTNNKAPFHNIRIVGGEGPDVFLFYGYSLHKRKNVEDVRKFGTFLHHCNATEAFDFMVSYARNSEYSDMLLAYLRGVFMHYILDRDVHPYVFYRSGFPLTNEPFEQADGLINHQYFEGALDYLYAKKHKTLINPKWFIKLDKESGMRISRMYYQLAQFLGISSIEEDTFYLAYLDMRISLRFLFSRTGFKKIIFHRIFKNKTVDAMATPHNDKKFAKFDILNESHTVWRDCITNAPRQESIDDLISQAAFEARDITPIFLEDSDLERKKMIGFFIKNIDHDGFAVGEKKFFSAGKLIIGKK